MDGARIDPYSPDWWKLRLGNFTGSEIWKLMTEPKGKSHGQRFEEHALKLAELEAKYKAIPEEKKGLKSNRNLKERIEKATETYKVLYEKRNDLLLSDTAETYILEKVHEKLTGKTKSGVDNFATQWGIENEPLAKKWYSKISGNKLEEPYMLFHPTIEGYSVTPDALVNETGMAEFKCPANGANHLKHWLISSDEYMKDVHPDKFYQVVAQMDVFEREFCDFVSFDPRIDNDKGMFIYNVKFPEDEAIRMRNKIHIARGLFNDYYELFSK